MMNSGSVLGLAVCAALPAMVCAQPADTSFTYQGELVSAGVPVTTEVDVQFKLFDSATAGGQIGPTLGVSGLIPLAGRFSTVLDFGPGAMDGSKRWLEIQVAFPGGAIEVLTPRQELRGTPYAQYALNIPATLTTFSNSSGNAVFTAGNVGVGTASPTAGLHVTRAGVSGLFFNVADTLSVRASDGFVGVNRTGPVTGAEVFGLSNSPQQNGYVGMYIKSNSQFGLPFYGYSTPDATAWTQMDNGGTWRLFLQGADRLSVNTAGQVVAASYFGSGAGLTGIPITNTIGALPIGRGGTGATAPGPAGSIAYSTGGGLGFTTSGAGNQFLKTGGAGAPVFTAIQSGDLPPANGDVTGPFGSLTVSRLQGRTLASTAPNSLDVLSWNAANSRWEPRALPTSQVMSGDVIGATNDAAVVGLRRWPISPSVPADGQVLTFRTGSGQWTPETPQASTVVSPLGNVRIVAGFVSTSTNSGPGFTVTRFGAGQYAINFNPIFAGDPIFTAIAFNSTNHTAVVYAFGVAAVNVRFYNSSGIPADTQFMFTAIGPR